MCCLRAAHPFFLFTANMKKKKQISPTVQPKQKAKVKAKAKPKPVPSTPSDVEYQQLFDTCTITTAKLAEVDKIIDDKVVANRGRYEDIATMVQGGAMLDQQQTFSTSSLFRSRPLFNAFSTTAQRQLANPVPQVPEPLFQQLSPRAPALSLNFKPPSNPLGLGYMCQLGGDISLVGNGRIPWYFIACVHYLECSFSFKKHLHNGDPLTGYTVQVPAGRPKVGHPPPFTFEESAVDALKLMGFDKVTSWKLPFILRKLEAYNGFGYFKYHNMNSPYLWSYSNHYTKGKYVKDGKFDKDAVSAQLGSAVILKRMEERGLIFIPRF
ncbi:hypothetical protein SAMN05444266_102315 [Chitinophaga jiangningensis]|uniref:Lysozyme family protein n=2 Tax=Chitinophaga jiangningensis TaxID=1419482 RepID=A0A1M6YHV1_9BACT|nr:hypothetical protein SAMN05444266_102315 [Chitinophaga jiangningensis]